MIDGSVLQSAQKCFEKKSRVVVKMVVNGHFVTANYTNTLELNKRITKQTDGTFHNSQRYIKCLWLIRIIWDLSKVKFNLFQPLEPKLIGQSIKRSLALAGDVGRSSDLSI